MVRLGANLKHIEDRNRSCDPRSYLQRSRKRSRNRVERGLKPICSTSDEPLLKDCDEWTEFGTLPCQK